MALTSSGLIAFEDLRSLGFASITASYVAVGVSFGNPIRILSLINTTDVDLLISFNGVDAKAVVAASSGKVYDFGTNKAAQSGVLEFPAGTRVYVKRESGAPASGTFYVEAVYAAQVSGG
jgi:hypothetical protein